MFIQSSTSPVVQGVGTNSSVDNASKIKAIQEQIRSLEQKIDEQQTQLQQYLADQNEDAAQMTQQLLSQYEQQLSSLNEQAAALEQEQAQAKISPPSENLSGRELPANIPEGDMLQAMKVKYDTFVPGFEDPAKEISVVYSLQQSEDGVAITSPGE